jgi:hypothetical protein
MPRRTNEFQKLVSLIQRALAPKGATVTDSAMVAVPGLAGFREIDVLIAGDFGPYRLKVAVEAKGLKRPLDLSVFESIVGKYFGKTGIPVNKVVVVTPNGFTPDVIREAAVHDITLLTLKAARGFNWGKQGPIRSRLQIAPHVCGVKCEPPIPNVTPRTLLRQAHVYCTCGNDHGTVGAYAAHLAFHHVLPQKPKLLEELRRFAQKQPNGHAIATIRYPLTHFVIRLGGQDHEVTALVFRIHLVDALGGGRCTAYELTSTEGGKDVVHHLHSTVGGKSIDLILPKGLKSEKILLKIDSENATDGERQ